MKIEIFETKEACGVAAADRGADILKQAIRVNGRASFIVATGASQFDFIKAMTKKEGIDWRHTTMYHLDEYIGMGADHPASFRRYLKERLSQVDYQHALTQGLPIGSGEIESGNRSVLQARLKIPGAWWAETNIRYMAALRLCRVNGDWDPYWLSDRCKQAA